jgi:hypothetical protein
MESECGICAGGISSKRQMRAGSEGPRQEKEENMTQLQQGDVMLEKVDELPADGKAVQAKNGTYVLAYGEATGHKHALEDVEGIKVVEKDGLFYVSVEKSALLTQEEHGTVMIPEGVWRVDRVREYDHFAQEARRVND